MYLKGIGVVISLILVSGLLFAACDTTTKNPADDDAFNLTSALTMAQIYIENPTGTDRGKAAETIRGLVNYYDGKDKPKFNALADWIEENNLEEAKEMYETLAEKYEFE
jgi:hypothetical protein